jgi:hypothetical protein
VRRLFPALALALACAGCPSGPGDVDPTPEPTPDPTPEPTPPDTEGLLFVDVTESAGIVIPRDGYGVASGDVDGDGWDDLVYAAWGQNQVMLNNGDGTFRVGTTEVGLPTPGDGPSPMGVTVGVTLVDHDGDGDLDLFFSNIFRDAVFCNDGGTFTDCSGASGDYAVVERASGTASFADYDHDGDLDLYVTGGGEGGGPGKGTVTVGAADRMLRNDGAAGFTDVSSGIPEELRIGVGFIAGWSDLDHDGDSDLYVVNDIGNVTPNQLFRNDGSDGAGGWTFTPITNEECGCQLQESGMGLGIADFDRDGWQDLYTSNGARLEGPNQAAEILLRNLGQNLFVDVSLATNARAAGPRDRESSWGVEFLDIDNNGWPDVFAPFGAALTEEEDAILLNDEGSFVRVEDAGGTSLAWAMSVSAFDYDHDGCLDLAVNYATATGRLFRNTCATGNHWLEIEFEGVQSNRRGIGVVATAVVGDLALREEVVAGSTSVYGSRPPVVHFGLGQSEQVERLEVSWPGGATQTLTDLPVDGRFRLVEGASSLTKVW